MGFAIVGASDSVAFRYGSRLHFFEFRTKSLLSHPKLIEYPVRLALEFLRNTS
jgi:hypothetical protein